MHKAKAKQIIRNPIRLVNICIKALIKEPIYARRHKKVIYKLCDEHYDIDKSSLVDYIENIFDEPLLGLELYMSQGNSGSLGVKLEIIKPDIKSNTKDNKIIIWYDYEIGDGFYCRMNCYVKEISTLMINASVEDEYAGRSNPVNISFLGDSSLMRRIDTKIKLFLKSYQDIKLFY